jgi:hypothetical protein
MKPLHRSFALLVGAGAGILSCLAGAPARSAAVDLGGTWAIERPQAVLEPIAGAIPFTPDGQKSYQANQRSHDAKRYDYDNAQTRCATPGLPRLMLTPARFHIWQRSDLITFQFEWNRLFYQVDMIGRKTEPLFAGAGVGVSKGQWQGGELVVKTDNFDDQTLIDALVPHSDEMKLTQRFKLLDHNTLQDRLTIEDPETFTRPWDAVVTYQRQPDAPFPEDVCIDRLHAGKLPLPPQ